MSLDSIKPYAKALVGALTAGLGAYATALDDGITTQEWVTVAIAALAGGGFVFGVPNKDPEAQHQAESVQPPHA